MRARIGRPFASAYAWLVTTSAAAPSFSPGEFPAVTTGFVTSYGMSLTNAGRSFASASRVLPRRGADLMRLRCGDAGSCAHYRPRGARDSRFRGNRGCGRHAYSPSSSDNCAEKPASPGPGMILL